jgi:hypothetical protein
MLYIKKETFDEDNKIVYIVWNDEINDKGFGDKLRGTIAIYQYCRSVNIKCKFDATLSTFGKYLKNAKTSNSDLTKDTPIASIIDIYDDNDAIENFIKKELLEKDIAYVFCNLFPTLPLSKDDLDFLNYITEPIDILNTEVTQILKTLPENFTIQHFRFGDEQEPNIEECEFYYQILENIYNKTDILISNSKIFKEYVLKKKEINVIQCEKCDKLHVGLNPTSEVIKYTL